MRAFLVSMGSLILIVAFLFAFGGAITNPTYQNGMTARYQAQQQTKRVEAQQWGATARTWGMWGGGGLAVVGGLVAIGWTVRHWQEQRTRRHEATEEHTTQRLRISTQKEIAVAWLAQFGVPERDKIDTYGGTLGVFTVEDGQQTFVPIDVCRVELAAQTTALARRQPQTINVPSRVEPQDWLPVGLPAEYHRFKVEGELEEGQPHYPLAPQPPLPPGYKGLWDD